MYRSGFRRHPWDRGGPLQLAVTEFFRPLLRLSFWRKHREPFSKTEAGRRRREERRLVNHMKRRYEPWTTST